MTMSQLLICIDGPRPDRSTQTVALHRISLTILLFGLESGAACVTRTRDPIITNDVLYQLS